MSRAAGVDALHTEKGCYERWYYSIDTTYEQDGHQLEMIVAIKKAVKIPVLGQGKLWDPAFAESALQEGILDFVGLGHQMLADPEWPKKVKENRIYDIRPCLGCNECINAGNFGRYIRCSVNPRCFREEEYKLEPAKEFKLILIR